MLVFTVLYEVLRQCFWMVTQWEMYPIMRRNMRSIAEASAPKGSGGMVEMMSQIQTGAMLVGFVFWLVWVSVKICFMLWARRYLIREHVVHYITQADPTRKPVESEA